MLKNLDVLAYDTAFHSKGSEARFNKYEQVRPRYQGLNTIKLFNVCDTLMTFQIGSGTKLIYNN